MEDESPSLKALLNELEEMTEEIDEGYIFDAISKLQQNGDAGQPPMDWLAERIAFQFREQHGETDSPSGTYFCPMMVLRNDDGTITEVPSLHELTPEIMNYWSIRAEKATHPVFKARYADLVWEFSKTVTGTVPSYRIAHIAIDSIVKIAKRDCYRFNIDVIRKLERALSLALSLGDDLRIQTVRDTILAYEDKIAEDNKPGLWGFSYDLLFHNKKIPLSESQRKSVISALEERLRRLSMPTAEGAMNGWRAEHAALRLAEYYRRNDCQEDLSRVLGAFGTAWEYAAKTGSPLQASHWLQRVHSVYLKYGLTQEAADVAVKLRQIGSEMGADLKAITDEYEIPQEEFERFISAMTEGDLDIVLRRIAAHFIPSRDEVACQLAELAKKAPLSFLFPIQLQDHKGRPVATIGSLEGDLDGRIVYQMTQNMQISFTFLQESIAATRAKFSLSADGLATYLYRSPVFQEDKRAVLQEGLRAYFDGRHMIAAHIFIPQIEDAFRALIELQGGAVLKTGRAGGFHLKTLDELLRDSRVAAVMGEDTAFYFRVLLTDPRGWNLRNDLCHGILPTSTFNTMMTDRLLHVLLCLGNLRGTQ